MRYLSIVVLIFVVCLPSAMAKKDKGTTTLKDVQPAGTTSKENEKQQFDFFFDVSGMSYVCRTSHKKEVKATDFVVGTNVTYELDEDEATLKNSSGEKVKCAVVRVEKLPAASGAAPTKN